MLGRDCRYHQRKISSREDINVTYQDAVEILEPMTKDPVDFVKQGAFVALGMILVQQSEAASPSISAIRALYAKTVSEKHEDPMARFGAVLGQGLIDAGGRNVTISLQSRAGSRNMKAIVGMVLFCQFWYWYPLAHCACLAFEPTGILGLNEDLKVRQLPHIIPRLANLINYDEACQIRICFQCSAELIRLSTINQTAHKRDSRKSCYRSVVYNSEGQSPRKDQRERESRPRRRRNGNGEFTSVVFT